MWPCKRHVLGFFARQNIANIHKITVAYRIDEGAGFRIRQTALWSLSSLRFVIGYVLVCPLLAFLESGFRL
jgi:hypothetical protein